MKKLLGTCAVLAFAGALTGSVLARNVPGTTPPPVGARQSSLTGQAIQPGQPDRDAKAPRQSNSTGMAVYNAAGREIGTISSVMADAQGRPVAIVHVERFLGMGGKDVQFPIGDLEVRAGGGYETNLSPSQIKALPAAQTNAY